MQKIIDALRSRNMKGYLVKDSDGARMKVLSLIDKKSRISFGGSMTLKEIGIFEKLKEGGYNLIDRNLVSGNQFTKHFLMKYGSCEGTYLTGTNAITEDGKIVNMDGWGNRVNAINYGPEKVIIVAGKNKIVKNLEAALERIRKLAAPKNTERLNKKTPCAKTGVCQDCRSQDRICNVLSVVYFQNDPDRIHVIIVDKELGY